MHVYVGEAKIGNLHLHIFYVKKDAFMNNDLKSERHSITSSVKAKWNGLVNRGDNL